MGRPMFETNLDARVAFKRLTGETIRLTPWEAIESIVEKDDGSVAVVIVTHTVEERKTETILTSRSLKLLVFVQSDTGWRQANRMVVPDPTFEKAEHIPLFGPGKTPAEWLMARQWERLAHRVGSSASPMDNYDRVGKGYTTARMTRHWA